MGTGTPFLLLLMTVHVNIGSNIGPGHLIVRRAASMIAEEFATEVRQAPVEVSEPWGFQSPNLFVNLGIAFESESEPPVILRRLRAIERAIDPSPHRKPDGSYADRRIDIDLIAMGPEVVATDELTLPHPRMHLRQFVLRPVALLEPNWVHPLTGLTAAEMLGQLV